MPPGIKKEYPRAHKADCIFITPEVYNQAPRGSKIPKKFPLNGPKGWEGLLFKGGEPFGSSLVPIFQIWGGHRGGKVPGNGGLKLGGE